jgi:hypothetical protein
LRKVDSGVEGDAVDLPGLEGRHGADPLPGSFAAARIVVSAGRKADAAG